jgi:hypothetical protein
MILKLLTLLVASIVWGAILWFALPIDFFRFSLPAIIVLHLLPPLFAWALCYGGIYWIKQRRQVRAQADESTKTAEFDQRKKAYKKNFDLDLLQRRTSIQCRWAQAFDVICHASFEQWPEGIEVTTAKKILPEEAWPSRSVFRALDKLFSQLPIASGFPVYVYAPLEECSQQYTPKKLAEHIDRARKSVPCDAKLPRKMESAIVFKSSISTNIHADISQKFVEQPDWPGLIVLAFDSLWNADEEADPWQINAINREPTVEEQWRGADGRALTCILLTPPTLESTLAKIDELP